MGVPPAARVRRRRHHRSGPGRLVGADRCGGPAGQRRRARAGDRAVARPIRAERPARLPLLDVEHGHRHRARGSTRCDRERLGGAHGTFEQSLGARFDIAFTDLADRDAAFKQYQYGDGGASWYTEDDYRRSTVFIGAFARNAGLRVVLWQVPMGNTKMRAENNTWEHYQDNKVEWLLDDSPRTHLNAYVRAGVVAVLFGRGADGPTCACDAAGDGVTDPAPINENNGMSLNADDDGGFFAQQATQYATIGPVPLPD